jgi:hypothetical protein
MSLTSPNGRKALPSSVYLCKERNQSPDYHRATLSNWVSGEREEIVLTEPAALADYTFLVISPSPELRIDLKRALSVFTRSERQLLMNILVRKMPLERAVAKRRKSISHWRRWVKSAIERLRADLSEYQQDGKVVL